MLGEEIERTLVVRLAGPPRMGGPAWHSDIVEAIASKNPDVAEGAMRHHLSTTTSVLLAEANRQGCETGFLSNGLLLKRDKLQQILDAGVDWICVSMDGANAEMYEKIRIGSNFERVCENVSNIAGLRSGNRPKTMINFVLMDLNFHQVEEIVNNYRQADLLSYTTGNDLYDAPASSGVEFDGVDDFINIGSQLINNDASYQSFPVV